MIVRYSYYLIRNYFLDILLLLLIFDLLIDHAWCRGKHSFINSGYFITTSSCTHSSIFIENRIESNIVMHLFRSTVQRIFG